MTEEEEIYLNTRSLLTQIAQLLRLHKQALISAFLMRRFPGIPFLIQEVPWKTDRITEQVALQLSVTFPTRVGAQMPRLAQQELLHYLSDLNNGIVLTQEEVRCRHTDSLAL